LWVCCARAAAAMNTVAMIHFLFMFFIMFFIIRLHMAGRYTPQEYIFGMNVDVSQVSHSLPANLLRTRSR
jgi:hypothetical protein